MTTRERETFVLRWQRAIHRNGHRRLLALPKSIKDQLANETDLIRKTLLLEELVEILK